MNIIYTLLFAFGEAETGVSLWLGKWGSLMGISQGVTTEEPTDGYDCESFLLPSTWTEISPRAGSRIGENWNLPECKNQCDIRENCVAFLSEQRKENGITYCWMFSATGDELVAVNDIQSGYIFWEFCLKQQPGVTTEEPTDDSLWLWANPNVYSGRCDEIDGADWIGTQEECAQAAQDLGFCDTTINSQHLINDPNNPRGCWFGAGGGCCMDGNICGSLYFNSGEGGTSSRGRTSLCKVETSSDPVVTSVYKKTDCRFDYSSTARSAGDYGAHKNTPKTLEECEALCGSNPECASFVVDQMGGGKCHLRTECPLVNEDCIEASSWNFINYVNEDCEASAPTSPPDNFPSDAWEQISDADGQYCVSMYNPHLNSNCRQACMDDNVCGAYTQYGNGWCQLIYSECTEWRNAADTSAISWRKQGQSLPDVWEQISDADGQYCVSMYNPHSNSNCRQACMDDNVCGAYTQYRNGWCQLIASECTEWRNAADTSAISWRKPGQQSKEQIKLDAESTAREYSMVEEAVANSLVMKGFAFVGALSIVGVVMQKYLQYKNEDKYITIEQEI